MAGTNNFKAFATGGGANVLSQADYEALATLIANGFTSGVADSQQVNKAIRQGSVISAAIGTIIANANLNALDDGDIGALANTLLTVFQRDGYRIGTVGGTVDAITAAFTPAIGTLTEGLEISLYCSGANTSTTPTLKADATLEKTIVKGNNLELDAGDILAGWHKFKYSTTLGKWVLLNPANGVASNVVPEASTTVKGKVQLATSAEAQALTDALKAITPSTLASILGTGSLGSSGYAAFPFKDASTGELKRLILQWGSKSAVSTTGTDVTFPIAFPNACLAAFATRDDNATLTMSTGYEGKTSTNARTQTGMSVWGYGPTLWIALGY